MKYSLTLASLVVFGTVHAHAETNRNGLGGSCSSVDVGLAVDDMKIAKYKRLAAAYQGKETTTEEMVASDTVSFKKIENAMRGCKNGETVYLPPFLIGQYCDMGKNIVHTGPETVACVFKRQPR